MVYAVTPTHTGDYTMNEYNLADVAFSLWMMLGLPLIIGWMMPRGRYLKALQLRVLRALHNFFADEEEYIAHKVERIRNKGKRKK
jgi:hypothetical protein